MEILPWRIGLEKEGDHNSDTVFWRHLETRSDSDLTFASFCLLREEDRHAEHQALSRPSLCFLLQFLLQQDYFSRR